MTTTEKITYLENLLKKTNCPSSEITTSAIQLLNYFKKHNMCVTELEQSK